MQTHYRIMSNRFCMTSQKQSCSKSLNKATQQRLAVSDILPGRAVHIAPPNTLQPAEHARHKGCVGREAWCKYFYVSLRLLQSALAATLQVQTLYYLQVQSCNTHDRDVMDQTIVQNGCRPLHTDNESLLCISFAFMRTLVQQVLLVL